MIMNDQTNSFEGCRDNLAQRTIWPCNRRA
jgi:hypothetical protein